MLTVTRRLCALALSTAVSLALGGCGGGGGVASIPTPTPSPTPTPTPSSTAAVIVFPAITASTQFAAIGLEAGNRTPTTLTSSGFSARYDSSTGFYVIGVPSVGPGNVNQYTANSPNARWWSGPLLGADGNWLAQVNVLKPSNPDLQLTYTTLATYNTSGMSPEPFGTVAFGIPTAASAMPRSGTASYTATVHGNDVNDLGYITGSASLQFNFGGGTLSGEFKPLFHPVTGLGEGYSLGTYTFTNTVYGAGSPTFSGEMSNPSVTGTGSFSGQFTGPTAEELMATWKAPFVDPLTNANSQMFGAWVGVRK